MRNTGLGEISYRRWPLKADHMPSSCPKSRRVAQDVLNINKPSANHLASFSSTHLALVSSILRVIFQGCDFNGSHIQGVL